MKIGIIGAGRVGFSLGKYLVNHNYDLMGYFSKTKESSLNASIFTNTECYESLCEIIKACNILFLCVNDDSIKNVVDELKNYNLSDKIICHTSGSNTSDIIDIECYKYSIHPIMAINDKYESYKSLEDCYYTIEGDERYLEYFTKMFKNIRIIDKESKPKYHALASLISNNINGLCYMVDKELKSIGLDFNMFKDLFINNANNIINKGYYNALTGPVERNDINVINKHLEALSDETLDVYILLAKSLAEMKNREEIKELLGGNQK